MPHGLRSGNRGGIIVSASCVGKIIRCVVYSGGNGVSATHGRNRPYGCRSLGGLIVFEAARAIVGQIIGCVIYLIGDFKIAGGGGRGGSRNNAPASVGARDPQVVRSIGIAGDAPGGKRGGGNLTLILMERMIMELQ